MTARKGNTFYNTKAITLITRKTTLMDQRAQEGKQALQQYLWTSSEEASIHTAVMTTMREIQKKRGHEIGNIYRLAEFNTGH